MGSDLEALGNRLKQARVNAGNPTIEDVAGTLHITKSYVSQMENGKKQPSWRHLIEFARLYNVSVDDLLGIGNDSAGRIAREDPATIEVSQDIRNLLNHFDDLSTDGRDLMLRFSALLLENETRRSSTLYTEWIVRAMVSDDEWKLIESARALARSGDEIGARRVVDDWLNRRNGK